MDVLRRFHRPLAAATKALVSFGEAVDDVTIAFAKLDVARYESDVARYGELTAAGLRTRQIGRSSVEYLAIVEQRAQRWRNRHRLLLELLPARLHDRVSATQPA